MLDETWQLARGKAEAQKGMATRRTRPKYEPPEVVTYQEDEILRQMGPVGGCVSSSYDHGGGLAPMNSFGYRSRRHRPGSRRRRYRSSLRSLYLEDDEEDMEDIGDI
jgi:hypothetical protein